MKHIPNIVTTLRFICAPFLAVLVINENYLSALVLALLMGLSDAVDGFLAKRFGWSSELGAFLDPLADKCMLITACYVLGLLGLVPGWLVAAIIIRDVVIVGGAISYHLLWGLSDVRPLQVSKINTCVQLALVFTVLFNQIYPLWPILLTSLFAVTGIAAVASGCAYVFVWGAKAIRKTSRFA